MRKTFQFLACLSLLFAFGCATARERKALRLKAEESIRIAEFEVQAAASPDVVRHSRETLNNAQLALRRAREEFDKRKFPEASQWAETAQKGAALAARKAKAAKEKESANPAPSKKKPAPGKKSSSAR